jgi:3-phenylpropionate/cinnamic acid dioxygenase small subunit
MDEDAAQWHEQGNTRMSEVKERADTCMPGTPLYGEIVRFLYVEAKLLDEGRFNEWVELFAEDIRYTMPIRTTQHRKSGEGFQDVGFFDENLISLQTRVKRLETDAAWAETPPSRTRHFITNILAKPADGASEFKVVSNFMITRTRADRDYQMFTGVRNDILRRAGEGQFKIAKREILIDQTVITGTNLSILF